MRQADSDWEDGRKEKVDQIINQKQREDFVDCAVVLQ